MMEARAKGKSQRISPRKARLVTRMIQGHPVPEALTMLKFSDKKAARLIEKVLRSAVANAADKDGLHEDALKVVSAVADEGPRMKRFRPRARGRAARIIKRTAHIKVVVRDE